MTIVAMNWAWGRRLKPTAKRVLMSLANAADDYGLCWLSISAVTRKFGVSTRTVRRIMQELVDSGLLRPDPRFGQDRSRSSNPHSLALEGG